MRYFILLYMLIAIIGCESKTNTRSRELFGNVFRIDSVAGQDTLSDPFFIVLTKDSLFNTYAHWGYSYPYETGLRINQSLEILRPKGKWTIEPEGERFWLNMDSIRLLYSIAYGEYDSAYKHLRIMKTQESLLMGKWEVQKDRTEANNILSCQFQERTLLEFTKIKGNHKIVQLINMGVDKIDTCLRRSYLLNGSDILINDYDTFPPYLINELNDTTLVIQDGSSRLIYFRKIS